MEIFHRVADLPDHIGNFSGGEGVGCVSLFGNKLRNITAISDLGDNTKSFLKNKNKTDGLKGSSAKTLKLRTK